MIRVVVPVKNQWQHTANLLRCFHEDECRVLVIDNGSTDLTPQSIRVLQRGRWRGRLQRTSMPGRTIYEMWNHGFDWANREAGHAPWRFNPYSYHYVLMTNNDIILPPGALSVLRTALEALPEAWAAYPDYDASWTDWRGHATGYRETRGVLSDGGMLGACFMLAGHRIPWRPLVTDLTYEWWYGDNHLAEEIEQHGGKQIRVEGLPVEHANEATASTLDPSVLYGMKYRDRQRWITRYDRRA